MNNKRNKSYTKKQIEADIELQGGHACESQLTMMSVNDLKSYWYVTNTRCVNSHYGKYPLTEEEQAIIRDSIKKLIKELEPIVRAKKNI